MKRQVSGIAIALLMMGLVIGVGSCYATDPEDLPWSNETDIIILPWNNETAVEERLDDIEKMLEEMRGVIYEIKYGLFGARVIKTPITPEPITNETDVIILPEPVTNETDVVIIVTDPLEGLNLRIDYLDTSLQDLTEEFSILQTAYDEHLGLYNVVVEDLYSEIDALIFKQSKLRTNIRYVQFATVVMAIVMVFGGWAITKDLAAEIRKTSEARK